MVSLLVDQQNPRLPFRWLEVTDCSISIYICHRQNMVKLSTITNLHSMPRQTRPGRQATTDRIRTFKSTRSNTSSRTPLAMSSSSANAPSSGRYMFIDQDADRLTSSEAIRVHVMRQSHRARRQLRGLIQSQESQGQMTILPNPSSSSTRPPSTNRDSGDDSAAASPNIPSIARRESEGSLVSTRMTPDTATPDLRRLVEQRYTDIINTPSQIALASPSLAVLKQLPANIIELCGDDSAALHALLALIASVQQSVGILQAVQYESSALEILRARLANTGNVEHMDETILTVLLLSRVERVKMNEETAGFHESALARMVEARGGLAALQSTNDALVRLLRSQGLGDET